MIAPGNIHVFLCIRDGLLSWVASWDTGDTQADGDARPIDLLPGNVAPSPAACWWIAAAAAVDSYLRHSGNEAPRVVRLMYSFDQRFSIRAAMNETHDPSVEALRQWLAGMEIRVLAESGARSETAWVGGKGHRAAGSLLPIGAGGVASLMVPQ